MNIQENLDGIKGGIPDNVTLVAVSKTKPVEDIQEAYNCGHRAFGENRVQEMVDKYNELPKDIQWHLIGHLQSNKVKYIAPFVSLIHAVDSRKLLATINKEAQKNDRVINCLLQIHIAKEETKFGMSPEEAVELLKSDELKEFANVQIVGLMGMATFTSDSATIRQEFKTLHQLYESLAPNYDLQILSTGMSGDYQIAIEEGSTMIRVGSLIFGERN